MKIAIVDDNENCRNTLKSYIMRYGEENKEKFDVQFFCDGLDFVSNYKSDCAVVFLDVEMPHLDGIAAAKKMREVDKSAAIVFVTNYSQYAINGYEVNAIDYVIKPMSYFVFVNKFKKAIAATDKKEKEIFIDADDGVVRIKLSTVKYIAMDKNYIVYHTTLGEFRVRGTMKSIRDEFVNMNFVCNTSGSLVNLMYVRKATIGEVYVDDEVLPISRSYRKEFMDAYIDFLRVSVGGR